MLALAAGAFVCCCQKSASSANPLAIAYLLIAGPLPYCTNQQFENPGYGPSICHPEIGRQYSAAIIAQ